MIMEQEKQTGVTFKDQDAPILYCKDLMVSYGKSVAVNKVSLNIYPHRITAIIGPSGCGKSTLLRTFNRMNDFVQGINIEGEAMYQRQNIYANNQDPVTLRQSIGMVFQKPNPFPKSIFENIAWAPKLNGYQGDIDDLVEDVLKKAALWDEVKRRLNQPALSLSGGQQQRLCIARALAMQPEVLLMDEPCSALDPISTARVEDLIISLKENYTIVIVTHNMQQAARISDYTAFMDMGNLIEYGLSSDIFTRPKNQKTIDYVTGRFG